MVMVASPVEVDGADKVCVNQRFIVNFVVRFSTSRGCCLGLGLNSRWVCFDWCERGGGGEAKLRRVFCPIRKILV